MECQVTKKVSGILVVLGVGWGSEWGARTQDDLSGTEDRPVSCQWVCRTLSLESLWVLVIHVSLEK